MMKKHLLIAWRNMRKDKIFSFINVSGLATGMMVCLMMFMYVVNQTSYDDYHKNKDRIHRVITDWGKEGSRMKFAGAMPAVAPALSAEVPEVEAAARIKQNPELLVRTTSGEAISEPRVFHADPAVFSIFDWTLLQGDPVSSLSQPFTVILTQTAARKYFDAADPMGRTLFIDDRPYNITGVLADHPSNTHLNCEFLISYATVHSLGKYPDSPWMYWGDDLTYFLLRENAHVETVSEKLNALMRGSTQSWFYEKMELPIQPLSAIHWDNQTRGDMGPKGNRLYVTVFLAAAILILAIACFNFMNLSTSRSMERMKEIGVRKVVGAGRAQLIRQFLTESLLFTLVAVGLGVVVFEILNPVLYSYLDASIAFNAYHFKFLYAIVIGMVFLVGLLAGSYPAWFLSRFRPVDIFRHTTARFGRRASLRSALVVVQFAISIILIMGTIILKNQIEFMKNSDLGFDKENVILAYLPQGDDEAKAKYPILKTEFMKNPNVTAVSGAYTVPGVNSQFQMTVGKKGAPPEEQMTIQAIPGDYDFVKAMGLKLASGRNFYKDFALDADESVLLNETAVQALDLKDPLGQKLVLPGNRDVKVIGIVRDFHVKSLHNSISPMLIYMNPQMYMLTVVKIKPENAEDTIAYLGAVWKDVLEVPDFSYRTMKAAYEGFYADEEKTNRLVSLFTVLALFISCLGLFGLTSFMTERRVKEIGIRKVLGASVGGITGLFSKQFAKWVLLSNFIAWPVAWLLLGRWLDNFAYRIPLTPMPFVLSGAAALLIAMATVSILSVKAALADPVTSLRYE